MAGGVGNKIPVTTTAPAPNCTGALSRALETCHLNFHSYIIDTVSQSAEQTAFRIASSITRPQCLAQLNDFHSGSRLNPTPNLGQQYPGVTGVIAENLHCLFFNGTLSCPGAQVGANSAMTHWINSLEGHRQTLDSYAGHFLNAGAICNPATGIYVAVAQFYF
ncbi:MAG: hypothetical protein EXQ79_01385 [Acidimicrobiia bacterium]|nr:hypothetical protein [Acidimicrobiia bacterium]